jgi:hypothetical protein
MIQRSPPEIQDVRPSLSGVHMPVEKKTVVSPAPLGTIWQPSRVCSIPRSASDTQLSPRCIHQASPSVDRELAPRQRMCPSDLPHVGEPVRIDGELDVAASTDAFAVPEHREVPGSVDVFDNASDVCVLSISDVEYNLPPTHEEVGLPRWSVGFGVVWHFRHERLSHAQPSSA